MSASLLSPPSSPIRPRRPRLNVYPPYARSHGPVAVQLAARAGLTVDPWQAEAVDVMLSLRPDGRWNCFEFAEIVSRQNGKGCIGEVRVLAGMFLLGERLQMWSAHEYKTAMEAFRRVLALLRALGTPLSATLIDVDGIPVKVVNTNGEESFERTDTGQRIKFHARSKGAGRGFTPDFTMIDEAFAYTPVQQAALMPSLSAVRNPQVGYLSSPPLDGESGDVLFNLRERAEAGGDDSLGYRDWGLPGDLANLDKVDLDDMDAALSANPAAPHRIKSETILRERRSMNRVDFARERLGIWPLRVSSGGTVLDPERWARMLDPESRRADKLALAVDVTPLRDAATIGMYAPAAGGGEHMQIVDHRPGTDWLVGRLVELRDVLGPLVVALDAKNGAAALIPELEQRGFRLPEDPEHPEHGDLLVTNAPQMADAVGQFIDGFRRDPATFRHHGQEPLDLAVRNAKARPIGDAGAIAWGRKASEVDIGPLITVTLGRYAYLQRVNVKDKTLVLTGSLMA